MANVLFKKGLLKNLPTEKVAGTIYVTTDERAMYLDVDASTRIRLGDFNEIPNLNALPDVSHGGGSPNPTGLYYSVAENVLARYDSINGKWAQINPDNWFEIKSFAQSLTSATDNNITTVTVSTTLTQMNEAGNQAGSGAASQWSNNLKFKDDGSVVTITKEGTDTIKISAKDEKVTSAANHYKYDSSRDGSKDLTPLEDSNRGNAFITGVTVDDAGHVVSVKSREAVIDLVTNPTLGTSTTTKDTDSDANSAANIDFSISHGGTTPLAHLKVEGAGATTVATSNGGKTLKISSTDQTVEYDHHYDPSTHESASHKIPVTDKKVISGIKRDNAGHVIGIEERDENKLSAVSMTSSGSENNVTLATQVSDSLGSPLGFIKITGSGDAKVTAAADSLSINIETHDTKVTNADNHYKALKDGQTDASNPANLISAGTYNASDITGATKTEAKAETPVITGVTIDAAGHVTGVKAVKIADTHNKLTGTGTASANVSEGNNINGWKFELTDTDGNLNYTIFDPTIKYGKDNEGATTQTVHGLGGSFTLDTYTTGEVDAKITTAIQATGAMVLKGELNSTQSLPTADIAAGDTYIVTENGITVAGNVCEIGDLLVAKSDMATDSTDANWYYVPSGNDRHIVIGTNSDTAKTVGAVLVDGNQTANVKYGSINFNSDASASGSLIKAEKFVDAASGDLGAQDVRFVFSMEWGSF